jgi:hypothetical protein
MRDLSHNHGLALAVLSLVAAADPWRRGQRHHRCLWAVSCTVGVPIGAEPWHPEAIAEVDLVSTIVETLIVLGCVGTLARSASPSRSAVSLRPCARQDDPRPCQRRQRPGTRRAVRPQSAETSTEGKALDGQRKAQVNTEAGTHACTHAQTAGRHEVRPARSAPGS